MAVVRSVAARGALYLWPFDVCDVLAGRFGFAEVTSAVELEFRPCGPHGRPSGRLPRRRRHPCQIPETIPDVAECAVASVEG